MSLLEIDGLSVRYGKQVAVDGVSFSVDAAESVGLVGESGSGKSQTALAVLGLLPATAEVDGSIRFGGEEILGAAEATLDGIRARRIAMVFQDPMQALNPYLSVGAQLRQVLEHHGMARGRAARDRVVSMLERVGLPDSPPPDTLRASTHDVVSDGSTVVETARELYAKLTEHSL